MLTPPLNNSVLEGPGGWGDFSQPPQISELRDSQDPYSQGNSLFLGEMMVMAMIF